MMEQTDIRAHVGGQLSMSPNLYHLL